MRVILWICFIPLPLLMAYMLSNETKFKKNIVVGVTLPYEARTNEDVQKTLGRYKKFTWFTAALLVLSGSACMLSRSDWQALENLMYWVLPCILLPYIPYVICNKELKRIKLQQGWGKEKSGSIRVDTSAMVQVKWLSPFWFGLALVMSLLPILWSKDFMAVYIADAACIVIVWLIYRFAYRNKAERVDENTELTAALSAARKKNWGEMFLAVIYFLASINMIMSFTTENPILFMVTTLIITVFLIVFAFLTELKTRKAQEELCRHCGKSEYLDDDDKWIWGLLYCNPDDEKLTINSRIGTNSTVNLAKPAGKLIAILSLAVFLSVPLIFPVANVLGNKPPEFELNDISLTARSGGTEYKIDLKDIKNAEILTELPEKLIKVSGTNFEDLLKGKFSAEGLGGVSVCLDPTAAPFLLIEKKDGGSFLLGSREDGVIEEIYKRIK